MYADELLKPWLDVLRPEAPGLELFDCHIGVNDPSGFSVTREQLLGSLDLVKSRAAVFPLKEPDGYREPNHRVIELAEENAGKLVAFCRIDPADQPVELAHEALAAGARGIKLHPSASDLPYSSRWSWAASS